jgi:CBS domain-containing protein
MSDALVCRAQGLQPAIQKGQGTMTKPNMKVMDLMTARPETVAPWDTLAAARKKMDAGHFRALPVVQLDKLVGVLSDRDILPFIGQQGEIPVKEAMTKAVVTIAPETALEEAAQLMLRHKIGMLPVIRKDELVGVITPSDIMMAYVRLVGESRVPDSNQE